MSYRPSSSLFFSLAANYKTLEDDLQYVSTSPISNKEPDGSEERYIFGEMFIFCRKDRYWTNGS